MSEDQKNMEVSQYHDKDQIVIPQLIHYSYLQEINGISFTSREIDIISCIIRGRRPNNIGPFLSIGVKNVENRIAGIKQKIGCKLQEGIIDFIEKSGKVEHFDRHYSCLLVFIEFERLLKKISGYISANISFSVIYDPKSKIDFTFIRQLNKHLELLGFKIPIRGINYHNIPSFIKTTDLKQHYIICCLSKALTETKPDIFNITKLQQEGFNPIIFISFENQLHSISNGLFESESHIDLTENKDYYSLFLKILKIIIKIPHLDKHFENFNKESLGTSICKEQQAVNEEKLTLNLDLKKIVAKNWPSQTKLWLMVCTLLSLLFTFAWTFFDKKKVKDISEHNYTLNSISRIEAKEICKLPNPCEHFTGREVLLNNIKKVLKENKKVVISGYQGIGKTQTAYQYAKLNSKEYAGGTYILKADTAQILLNSIRSFAIAMGVVNENQINHLSNDQIKKIIVPLLQNHLEKHEKMLIVLDNVGNYEDIRDLISTHPKQHEIIITSCNKKWGAWNVLELKEFDHHNLEAEDMILKVLKNESLENANKLANKLGYYPLAISQAINYLKNNNMITIDNYIREYDSLFERRKAFLNYQSFEQNNYIKTTLTAFEISKNTLIKEQSDAYQLLKLCAYFSHDIIPITIFKSEVKNIYEALEALNKYSLLDISNINGDLYINMHNILRDNVKIHIYEANENVKMEEKVINLIDKYLVYDFWDNKNIDKVRIIMPHVDYFLSRMITDNNDVNKIKKVTSILSKSGAYYIHCLRDSNEAIRLLENARKLANKQDPNGNLTNIIMEDLATSYYYFGEFNKARQEIDLVQKRNGATELSYLIKGHILYNECRYDEAEAAYDKVLKLLNKSKNSQYLAITHRSLGLVFYRKSQFSSPEKSKGYIDLSKEHLEKALEMHAVSNSENLELAISKHAYGRTAIRLNDLEKAELALSDALRIAKNYCKKDEDHYEALVIKRSYGHFLCINKKMQFGEGLTYLQQALDGKIRLFKNKPHQSVIGTIELIVDVYSRNPRNKELRKMMPQITQYLEDWTTSVHVDKSKHINKDLMSERIYTLKETINKVNRDHNIIL